jgi:uncharacterized protein YndB with AHSA1/START domain
MKARFEVIVNADRNTVWDAFDNPDNIPQWQPTLKSFTHKSGTPGEVGAITELVYDENDRELVMSETITERRRPDFMAGIYTTKGRKSLIVNYFEIIEGDKTRWVRHANHNFSGFMKLVSPFIRKTIFDRTDNDMQRFKLMIESQRACEN